jgi:hypothetical protein
METETATSLDQIYAAEEQQDAATDAELLATVQNAERFVRQKATELQEAQGAHGAALDKLAHHRRMAYQRQRVRENQIRERKASEPVIPKASITPAAETKLECPQCHSQVIATLPSAGYRCGQCGCQFDLNNLRRVVVTKSGVPVSA